MESIWMDDEVAPVTKQEISGAAALALELFTDREHCTRLDEDTLMGLVI